MTPEQRIVSNRKAINAYRLSGQEPKIQPCARRHTDLVDTPPYKPVKQVEPFTDGFFCGLFLGAAACSIAAIIVIMAVVK